ncbi:hypothetical protein EVG20_g9301 [Dentipellis fragilis]|uniref:Uncharacterized protein n=1 Tax=Dentipellis fragilis TaxID=205917 RepID=A0A4Y9XZ15_9AGAM|nr:hypothetical protein EVG20_g9301 [Dentipellis fragilis]
MPERAEDDLRARLWNTCPRDCPVSCVSRRLICIKCAIQDAGPPPSASAQKSHVPDLSNTMQMRCSHHRCRALYSGTGHAPGAARTHGNINARIARHSVDIVDIENPGALRNGPACASSMSKQSFESTAGLDILFQRSALNDNHCPEVIHVISAPSSIVLDRAGKLEHDDNRPTRPSRMARWI